MTSQQAGKRKAHPEGPSTHYLRTLVPNTIKSMVFGTRVLKYWVLGPGSGSRDRLPPPKPGAPDASPAGLVSAIRQEASSGGLLGDPDSSGAKFWGRPQVKIKKNGLQTKFKIRCSRDMAAPSRGRNDEARIFQRDPYLGLVWSLGS